MPDSGHEQRERTRVKGETDRAEAMRERTRRRGVWLGSWLAAAGLLVATVVGIGGAPAGAVPTHAASWHGNGVSVDAEGAVSLGSEVCGTENGAPVDGAYLQWVLVAKGPTSATLTLGSDAPVTMVRHGNNGTFQYVQTDFGNLADVVDGGATASYIGKADPKAKVVLGSGCIGATTLTVVSAVPFGVVALGLTEAECLSTTATGPAEVFYEPGVDELPSQCVAVQETPPTTTDTIVMPIDPDVSFTPPESSVTFNAAVIKFAGTYVSNPACTATGPLYFCLVTSSATVTIQAPPA
jgi:hypothetical protein